MSSPGPRLAALPVLPRTAKRATSPSLPGGHVTQLDQWARASSMFQVVNTNPASSPKIFTEISFVCVQPA